MDPEPLLDDAAISAAFEAMEDGNAVDDTPPSDPPADPTPPEPEDTPEDEEEDLEGQEEGDAEDAPDDELGDGDDEEPLEVPDDYEFTVQVGDEEVKVSAADLKQLAGRDAAIQRKASLVIQQEQQIQEIRDRNEALYTRAIERIDERLKPFEEYDAKGAYDRKEIDAAQYDTIVRRREELKAEKAFYTEGLDQSRKESTEAANNQRLARAERDLALITDQASPLFIPDFQKRYKDLSVHAVESGADPEFINNLSDPFVWSLINTSFTRAQAEAALEQKKKDAKPKASGRRTARSRRSSRSDDGAKAKQAKAVKRLADNPGDHDAAIAAFAAIS